MTETKQDLISSQECDDIDRLASLIAFYGKALNASGVPPDAIKELIVQFQTSILANASTRPPRHQFPGDIFVRTGGE